MRPGRSVQVPAILLLLLLLCTAAYAAEVPCPGNCNGDGSVTVDELVRGVNMALGNLAVAQCPAFDVGGDGVVTVDELIQGVNAALNGCVTEPSPGPTPSAGPDATETVAGTPSDTPTSTAVPTGSALPASTDTPAWSPVPSATPTDTFTPTPTPSPTVTYTATPTSSPTPTATVALPPGPVITFFGVARAGNTLVEPSGTTLAGTPIYERPTHFGFIILVEGHPGTSGKSLSDYGTAARAATGSSRASLQILASNALGDGSPAVCDVGPRPDEPIGGVPAVNPIDFGASQQITDAINDFACRFDFHTGADTACTLDELGNFAFASKAVEPGTRQYCAVPAIGRELAFPSGDTTLTVQLVDSGGNVGNTATLILRIP